MRFKTKVFIFIGLIGLAVFSLVTVRSSKNDLKKTISENSIAENMTRPSGSSGVKAEGRDSAAYPEASASRNTKAPSEFEKWRIEAGFRRPPAYEEMTKADLKARSAAGDKFASQKLGELAWEEYGNRDDAVTWLRASAEQGSVAALNQLSMMFDPDSDAMMVRNDRFGNRLEGSRAEAYVWARVAAMRGDPDAIFGVGHHSKYLSDNQVTQLELLALDQYQELQDRYKKKHGRGFINTFPVGEGLPHHQVIQSKQ